MHAREPASFWRENLITVVIPTTSFSENVVVAEASYEMLEVVSFCNQEGAYRPSIKLTVLTFLMNQKYNEAFRGVFFENTRKKLSTS